MTITIKEWPDYWAVIEYEGNLMNPSYLRKLTDCKEMDRDRALELFNLSEDT